ncbi:MAG TPA: hypothetical protein VJY39_23810 [Acidisphaera sp.]|nr:hypothetical protein [Acidisphaera sp.]
MTVDEAVSAQAEARRMRAEASAIERSDPASAAERTEDAEALEISAQAALAPATPLRIGRGGELVRPDEAGAERFSPDLLHAEASEKRLHLLGSNAALGLDLADGIGAKNSAEKAMAHELAKAHELAMRMMGQAARFADKAERFDNQGAHHEAVAANIEAARSANVAARLMGAFQAGLLTFDTLRNGRKQTVVVQRQQVTLQDGGQAVVAGTVQAKGRGA